MKPLFLLAIAAYVALLWTTGFLATRKKSASSESYLRASRRLSVPLISVLIAGTWTGGVSVVGMAQGAFIHGVSALWFQVGIWIAMPLTALLFSRIISGRKTYSILDVVADLYDRRTGQVAGFLQLVFSVWVVTMQIVGGGAILSHILKDVISFREGMFLTALVFTFYNAMGGFVATAYTNLIHLAVMTAGLFIGGIYVVLSTNALAHMAGTGHYFNVFGDLGVAQGLSWAYINLTLGIFAQPVINTASSAASVRKGKIGIVTGNLIAIPIVVMAALIGIAAKYLFPGIPSLSALPALLDVMPPCVAILFLLAMWAPLMSAGSPFLMGATTLAVKGYVGPLLRIESDARLLMASRMTTLALGFISLLLGFFVREILREVTWLGVLLSAIVCIVFFGWLKPRPPGSFAFAALLGTIVIVFVSLAFGLHRLVHPVWPVTVYVVLIMLAGRWRAKKSEIVQRHNASSFL